MDDVRPAADQRRTGDPDGRREGTAESGDRDPEATDDFADEHSSPTFAPHLDGGPERAREPETPEGLAGMD